MPSVPPFANLRHLHLNGPLMGVRNLVNVIVAPELEDVELVCQGNLDDDIDLGVDIPEGNSDVLYVMFNLFSRRNALSLRRFHFTHTDADVPLLPDPAATATQATGPGSPLLELRALQDVMILQALRDVKYYAEPNILGWVNAWPRLRTLALSALVVFPETLQYIARTCPQVESLTVWKLSTKFVESLSRLEASSAFGPIGEPSGGRPALRAFCVHDYFMPSSSIEIGRVACFFDSLFHQLDAERFWVPCLCHWPRPRGPSPFHGVRQKLKELQLDDEMYPFL
ncbi:uncharacterized protein B0H18DRAFT_1029401 [Fomitopsis serialis]|uniref:uncharacterized protein n=1 Tax=Fomitopsis serialis TaxID=139415 RepID=UPI002007FE52|nr:uncharacterized protein B0H18DRAFT_1029401 [Neoantrodia serialis]KAH9919018.1 hypothetical protein B0H18DRAFT_1029401 [Neoantrodia serialis]